MRNSVLLWFSIGLIACVGACALYTLGKQHANDGNAPDELNERFTEPVLAVCDRGGRIADETVEAIKHYVVKWRGSGDLTLQDNLMATISSNQAVLLTVEMWAESESGKFRKGTFEATFRGEYDGKIKALCNLLSKSRKPIYIRWNPEMETPAGVHPWQNPLPDPYIRAFRHFAKLFKEFAPGVKIVWGPTGSPGDLEYWPGTDMVDLVSVTLGSRSEACSKYPYPQGNTTTQVIKSKLHRLRFVDKPILILGSPTTTKENFHQEWLQTAVDDIRKHKERILAANAPTGVEDMHSPRGRAPNTKPLIGVHDPKKRLVGQKAVSVEHLFANLRVLMNGAFRKEFEEVISRRHDVIVTVEIWDPDGESDVLASTVNGRFDAEIQELHKIASSAQQTVYLRWAHEMEIPIQRYPWQSKDPMLYIEAFRYFAAHAKNQSKNIRIVWGPAGDRASLDFWPGDDTVDFISLAIYGLPDLNISDHKKQKSFRNILERKLHRLRFVSKPIFLAEIGVNGPEAYQKAWLKEAALTINNYPEILGVCYFNVPDTPKAWGEIEAPEWSISEETFKAFTESLTGVSQNAMFKETR
jgi:beta-mannanase